MYLSIYLRAFGIIQSVSLKNIMLNLDLYIEEFLVLAYVCRNFKSLKNSIIALLKYLA